MTDELQSGQPSRFHKYEYRRQKDGNHVGRWVLNQQHPELPNGATVKIGYHHHCAYCGKEARPLQRHLGKIPIEEHGCPAKWRYDTTGYACDCAAARAERQFRDEAAELDRSHKEQRQALWNKYSDQLSIDHAKLATIKVEREMGRIKRGFHDHLPVDNYPQRFLHREP